MKGVTVTCKNPKRKQTNNIRCFDNYCIFVSLLTIAHKDIFMDEYYLRTGTTASCDQFKPIRIEENLVLNYVV